MKNESTSTARYFLFLVLVFVVWILLFKFLSKEDSSVRNLFGMKRQSLTILNLDYDKGK